MLQAYAEYVCISIYLSTYLSIDRPIDRSIDLSIYQSIGLSIDLSIYLSYIYLYGDDFEMCGRRPETKSRRGSRHDLF